MRKLSILKEFILIVLIMSFFLGVIFSLINLVFNDSFKDLEFTKTEEYKKQKQEYLDSL